MVKGEQIVDGFRGWVARLFVRFRTRYTRALEEEVARLRAQNHALMNSILGVAGIPPMRMVAAAREVRADSVTQVGSRDVCATDRENVSKNPGKASRQPDIKRPAGRELRAGATLGSPGRGPSFVRVSKTRPYECEATNSETSAHTTPLRKRSWQQIERAREIEDARAARRERETDTETFPTPRNIVPRV